MTDWVFFGKSRFGSGPWRPGRKVKSIVIFGASSVDLRQAQLEEGITTLVVFDFFGVTDTVVASDIPVTLTGLSILGIRKIKRSQAKALPSPTARSLRVSCISIVGRLTVKDMP